MISSKQILNSKKTEASRESKNVVFSSKKDEVAVYNLQKEIKKNINEEFSEQKLDRDPIKKIQVGMTL